MSSYETNAFKKVGSKDVRPSITGHLTCSVLTSLIPATKKKY